MEFLSCVSECGWKIVQEVIVIIEESMKKKRKASVCRLCSITWDKGVVEIVFEW